MRNTKMISAKRYLLVALCVQMCAIVSVAKADSWTYGHTITSIQTGGATDQVAVTITPTISGSGCTSGGSVLIKTTNVQYELVKKLFISALLAGKTIDILYNGCDYWPVVKAVSVLD